jgi:hypothetical protein
MDGGVVSSDVVRMRTTSLDITRPTKLHHEQLANRLQLLIRIQKLQEYRSSNVSRQILQTQQNGSTLVSNTGQSYAITKL